MSVIKFACTSFDGTQKTGNLPVDENGYRLMPIGALNILNSAGQWYEYDGAKALFENSSQLMRRVQRGVLKGEVGHPKQEPGMTDDDYMIRIMTILESNVCAHFAEISLDFKNFKGKDGKPVIAIMGLVGPSGPHGAMLEKSLKNPRENVCFSIRSFTQDSYNSGRYNRVIKNVITFDFVTEPGIHIAEKFKSPSIESLLEKPFTEHQMRRAFENRPEGVGLESMILSPQELFKSFGWNLTNNKAPTSKW